MLHSQSINLQQLASNPAILETLLLQLTEPAHAAQATKTLTQFLENIESCGPLLHCLANSSHKNCRNLCAIYLRKKMGQYSDLLEDEAKNQIKQVLLRRLAEETEADVLRGLGALVIQASRLFSWHEELLNFLTQMFQTGNVGQQEIAVIALRNMVAITEGEPFQAYVEIFGNGLQGSDRMQIESLKGLAGIAGIFAGCEEQAETLKQIFGAMATICEKYVENDDENLSRYVVEMWDDLLCENALSGAETEICRYMLKIGARQDLKVNVRYQIVDYMKHYCQRFPNRLIAEDLLQTTMEFCIHLLMENYSDDNPDDISNPLNMSIEIMDTIFLNVRVDHTSNLALKGVQTLMEQNHVKSALALLAIMTEGCAEILKEENLLDQLKSILDSGMSNSDPETRKVAYEALTQFVYHVSPQMNKYADSIMPSIFRALEVEQSNPKNLESVCITLDSYTSALDKTILPYLDQIVDVLMQLLSNGGLEVKEAAVSALASTLSTAREIKTDLKRIEELAEMLLQIINNAKEEETYKIRAEATNCMGEICLTIGAQQTQELNNRTNLIRTVMEGLQFDSTELKEFTFAFFGTLAELFKDSILQTDEFQFMFQKALEILQNEEGLIMAPQDDGFGNNTNTEMDGDELDDDLLTTYKFYCQTGFLEEKTAAAGCLEAFARFCGPGFSTYWDPTAEAIIDCMSYPHPILKQAVTRAFHFLIENILKTFQDPGCINNIDPTILNSGRETLSSTITLYLVALVREEDRDCCVETLVSIAELLKINTQDILGLNGQPIEQAMNNGEQVCNWEEFMNIIEILFDEEAMCQSPDDVQLETKREQEDNPILDALTDICQALAAGLTQEQLIYYWNRVFPRLPKYLTSQRSHIEYSLAIGCIGDISAKIDQEHFTPYLEKSLELAFTGLNASHHHLVRQNSVYALGCICRASGNKLLAGKTVVTQILQFLGPICEMPRGAADKRDRLLRDNGFSALGCLLAWVDIPEQQFSQLFSVFIQGLPIEQDVAENQWVVKAILRILVGKQNLIQPYFQSIGQLLQASLEWEEMPKDVLQEAQNALFVLSNQAGSSSI